MATQQDENRKKIDPKKVFLKKGSGFSTFKTSSWIKPFFGLNWYIGTLILPAHCVTFCWFLRRHPFLSWQSPYQYWSAFSCGQLHYPNSFLFLLIFSNKCYKKKILISVIAVAWKWKRVSWLLVFRSSTHPALSWQSPFGWSAHSSERVVTELRNYKSCKYDYKYRLVQM